jgi:hypothetical protein
MSILNDGHPTLVSFSLNPTIEFKEKTVTPPGIDGGGENDTTTMRNEAWRTRQPKSLKTLSEFSMTCAYDPVLYDSILAMVNVNQQITVTFPDESEVEFWGWLNAFTPNEVSEGEQPTAEIAVIPSNQDNSGVEQPPVYTAP